MCTTILTLSQPCCLTSAALGIQPVLLTSKNSAKQICGCLPAGLGTTQKSSLRASRCTRTCPSTRSSCSTCGDPSSSRQVTPLVRLPDLPCCSPCVSVQPNYDCQNNRRVCITCTVLATQCKGECCKIVCGGKGIPLQAFVKRPHPDPGSPPSETCCHAAAGVWQQPG